MLHELILALSGYHGDIFIKTDGKIKVANELQFIHPTEESFLNRTCRLATHYVGLIDFIRENGHLPGGRKQSGLHGLYIRAFCQGLEQVLDPYRQKLVALEQELMADPHLTLTYIQSSLDEYQDLFPVLTSVIQQLQQHKVHGCNILEILHREAAGVTAKANAALLRIQHVCHAVLYRQLASWMLHGILLDKYDEFFVQAKPDVGPDGGGGGYAEAEDADEEDLGLIGGLTGKQLKRVLDLAGHSTDLSRQERFSLRTEMLPSYLPTRVAEKILFVGESVQIFESERSKSQQRHKESILKEKEDEFARDLHHLSQETIFSVMNFEDTIDKIRCYVSERLWKLVVEDADILSQLKIMKDFYLLGRGELFLAFIDKAQPILRSAPTNTIEHDINSAFHQAAHNVFFDDDKLLQKLEFKVAQKPGEKDKSSDRKSRKGSSSLEREDRAVESSWSSIWLHYHVEWPIHIMLTPSTLDRYNVLFKFLLLVKRVETELQQCWALQMQRKHTAQGKIATSTWWLRNSMAFLINNLQYYLQVDVIESQFTILQEKIHSTRDFETIRHAQDTFVSSLLSQSFLLMKPVSHCLHEIMELCHKFHNVLMYSEIHLTDQETKQIESITKDFQRQSNLLFKILSSVRSHQSSPHLAQLLLRLDYNKYFTQAGGQLASFAPVKAPPQEKLPSSSRR